MAIIPAHKHPTLRALRHTSNTNNAKTTTSTRKDIAPQKATATLSVKEKIARRSLKPIIQGRQFKWISPAQKMKEMIVDLVAVRTRRNRLEGDQGQVDETHSLFSHALISSCLLNLSLPFVAFFRSLEPKSRSLPLVVHHRNDIVKSICTTLLSPAAQVDLCGETILE